MVLIVGLGNPGPRYAGNRHNIGFMVIDAIVRRHGLGPWRRRFQGEVCEGVFGGTKVVILKPATFMNASGRSVGEAVRYLKLEPADVIVFHDELDLAPGKLRLKHGGGAAGHNGLRSITEHIGPHFTRARLGVGHPGHRDLVHSYVLKDFAKADADWLEPLVAAVAENIELLVAGEEQTFANRVHLALNPPQARKAENKGAPADESRQATRNDKD